MINKDLTSIVIPKGVTSIEECAFDGCKNLTSIEIPSSVTKIGNFAFQECSSLESITIPASVKSIGIEVFKDCISLKQVIFDEGCQLSDIGNRAFYGCSKLTSIIIPASVKSIGRSILLECISLTSVFYDGSIEDWCKISFSQFWTGSMFDSSYCSKNFYILDENGDIEQNGKKYSLVTELVIPDGVSSIGNNVFLNCSSLTSVVIPSSVKSIGDGAFSGCSSLTSVVIPSSVKSIGHYAFSRCSSLTCIEIPKGVKSISSEMFDRCDNLTSIIIPSSVKSIGDRSFERCSKLESIMIPSSVKSIGHYAFSECSSLTSIVIPSSVKSIGTLSFHECYNLTSIVVHENNKVYDSRNNCNALIETVSNKLIKGCNSTVIPNTITSIEKFAFLGCSSLTTIVIPASLISIGEKAFQNCKGLTNIIVDKNNIVYDSRDNCNAIIESSSNTLIVGCQKTIIPKSVQTINCSFDGVEEIIINNPNVQFSCPIGDVKKITFVQTFEENTDFIKHLLFILGSSNGKTKVIFVDQITGNVTNSYTLSEIKKMNRKMKRIKKELEIKKNNELINFSYNYIINQIDDNTFEIVDKKKSIKVNVFKSFNDFDFGFVELLYALKRKKDGTFSSGAVSSAKKNAFYEFCDGNDYTKWPGYREFDSLDEMQNFLDKCNKRTNKKTISIYMSTESFECIEITKLKFKDIEKIVNGNSYWQGFYLANSKIYAVNVYSE